MIAPIFEEYKNKEYVFPSRDINPKDKKDEYCRKNAEAIYSLFLRNKLNWGAQTWEHFSVLRSYSRGEQSIGQYKSWLINDVNDTNNTSIATDSFDSLPLSRVAKRGGWYNVLWKNISPAPMIMNAIHGMFDKLDFDLYCNVIDPDSRALEEEAAYIKLIEAQNAEWQNKIKTEMGIPIDEDVILPKSKEELDMLKARDGFKLNVSRAIQKIVRHSFDISRWDNVVLKKLIDDLVCLGYCVTEDYFDSEDGKFKCAYADPSSVVAQFSNETDYSDMEYCGQYKYVTISNLRNKLPDCPEKELMALANTSRGFYGNPQEDWDSFYSKLDPSTKICNYNGFKVPVFRACWIDTNTNKKLYYDSKYGRKSIIPIGYDTEVKSLTGEQKKAGASQEVKSVFVRQPYECWWVVGTKYVYDFGAIKMASRASLSKPQLPFHIEQLLQPSIIDRLVPILDQITLTFLRYQNSLAMMFEKGIAVNLAMLANVNTGGGKLKPAEVVKLAKQTGVWFYQYSPGTGLYTGGAATPVTPIDGGMGTRVEETIRTLEMWMKEIEHMTGINPVSLGGTPDPNAPVGTTQAALQATANVLKPIIDACFEVKQSTGECLMRRIQIGIRNSDRIRKAYMGVIAPADMEALKLMESEGVQYGLTMKVKPDRNVKMRFEKWIDIALQNTREQRPGIDLNDAIYFMSRLESGADLNELEKELEYAIEKNKQEAQQNSERMIQAQGEQNAQLAQQNAQAEMVRIKAEADASIAEEAIRGQIKNKQTILEGNLALLEAARQAADAEQGININTGGK